MTFEANPETFVAEPVTFEEEPMISSITGEPIITNGEPIMTKFALGDPNFVKVKGGVIEKRLLATYLQHAEERSKA